tara:strand:+ start:65 stop:964 length:900 start_codon:yes stop_codon:yes gene_type:complete
MKQFWNWKNHQIAWQVFGENSESPISIVLIHGFGASKDHWRFNQKEISSIAPCYAIDLVGFGESSQPKAQLQYEKVLPESFNYCFDTWSQEVVDFCIQIIKKPVVLVGNSIGGVIALNASKKLDKLSLGVVLINCAQRTMDDKRLSEQTLFMRLIRPIIKVIVRQRLFSKTLFNKAANPKVIKKILKIAYPSGNNIDQELIDILYKPTLREGAPEAFRGFINLFNDDLAPDLLKNSNKSVYLIWGDSDPWEPVKEAQKWFEGFKCVKSIDIISNAGHCPHDEMPEKVNPILSKIIQEAM